MLFTTFAFVNMEETSSSTAWSKSLKSIPYLDSSFIDKWLEKDGKVPKKVISRGYSNFCEGYIFDVEGKFQRHRVVVFVLERNCRPVEQLCDSHNLCLFEYRIKCFTSFIRIFEDRNLLCFKPQCCKLPYSAQYSKFTCSKTSRRRSPRKS